MIKIKGTLRTCETIFGVKMKSCTTIDGVKYTEEMHDIASNNTPLHFILLEGCMVKCIDEILKDKIFMLSWINYYQSDIIVDGCDTLKCDDKCLVGNYIDNCFEKAYFSNYTKCDSYPYGCFVKGTTEWSSDTIPKEYRFCIPIDHEDIDIIRRWN